MNPDEPGPFDKDTLESKSSPSQPSSPPPLSEKDFIQESPSPAAGFPIWLWIFLATAVIAIIWGMTGWYQGVVQKEKKVEPFLDVSNRDFSVFLWQFPSFLRSNVSNKTGYLPGFLSTKETLNLSSTEDLVSAPPDLLFLYHTWKRLLVPNFIPRSIAPGEFEEFLQQVEEWQPKNWKKAPEAYVQLIQKEEYKNLKDLQTLPDSTLPLIVRQAFQGWKNYYKEGSLINEISPTISQILSFLKKYPNYRRNYWRNIEKIANQDVAGLDYLSILLTKSSNLDEKVPVDQVAPFLKVALFNAEQAEKEQAER
ncbi:hypothetical protein [Candidatus Protochlamydia phocaeensis]|uniref:hypothetical protein n=1 Tax=Candidatus Protochlamydia phocaeensis TaxID=1414722 RepID=UPI000838FBEB|nr:hypothetical protein [Candidatus Protochlamydia phocaeensis]